jgi:hypothetical protein
LLPVLAAALVFGTDPLFSQTLQSEAHIFSTSGSAVVRVESGLRQGTGFFVTATGLIATNDHVIGAGQSDVSVYLDSVTRVRAIVVGRNADADLALIGIHPSHCKPCQPLALADEPLRPQPGERVVALGYPLGQPLSITSGLVSNVRSKALLTDVSLNPGNSGGPILRLDGKVIAIATFRDIDASGIGPGLSGGILTTRLRELLASTSGSSSVAPSDSLLPPVPIDPFPVLTLRDIADSTPPAYYDPFASLSIGPFDIAVVSPLSRMVSAMTVGKDVGKDRSKREARADVPTAQRYRHLGELRDWQEYVGDPTLPVIAVRVTPRVSETTGSTLGRITAAVLLGADLTATVRFDGDVKDVRFMKGSQAIRPLSMNLSES